MLSYCGIGVAELLDELYDSLFFLGDIVLGDIVRRLVLDRLGLGVLLLGKGGGVSQSCCQEDRHNDRA